MKLIEKLRKDLAKVGAALDDGDYTLNCDAPKGYTWRANGCAHIAIHYANNDQSWLAQELRTDGYPRLRLGLDKVTDPAELAAFRNDLDDDTWGAAPDAPDFIAWAN